MLLTQRIPRAGRWLPCQCFVHLNCVAIHRGVSSQSLSWVGASPTHTPPSSPLSSYLAKLSSVGSISEEETCEKLKGLIQRQVQLCKRNLEVMDSVRRGAQLAIEECQYQFRNRRWNCSTLDSLPVFGKVVTQGERDTQGGLGEVVCHG